MEKQIITSCRRASAPAIRAVGLHLVFGAFLLPALGSVQIAWAQEIGNLEPPEEGKIRVAFVVTNHANVIDFAGPWEVFQDVFWEKDGSFYQPFESFTVSDTRDPVTMTNGLRVLPDYTFDDAPSPHVIVVGAQAGSDRMLVWLKKNHATADVIMSVCTGAFQLAKAGLLDGLKATTHHDFFDRFEKQYPAVDLQRGYRFVEGAPNIATAGGLTSGFDMALRVVERYFDKDVVAKTAEYMEYRVIEER